ncbi:MAG TPA: hypothetical protein VFE59_14520 [Trebonia sp.]|nr:hypothetical protein [Trebonia sp.]
MSTPSPAGSVRSRLRAALRSAMKERDTVAAAGLRSALAAIANAEAVPLPASPGWSATPAAQSSPHFAGAVAGLGAAEVSRREVTDDEAAAIAAAEAADRRAAARDYQAAVHADRAGRLRREAQAIESALDITPPRDDA